MLCPGSASSLLSQAPMLPAAALLPEASSLSSPLPAEPELLQAEVL